MALLFCDGFDHYATADLTKKWDDVTNTPNITTGGRRGGGRLAMNQQDELVKSFSGEESLVVGFFFVPSSAPSTPRNFVVLKEGGLDQCALALNSDLSISVLRGTSYSVTNGTSAPAVVSVTGNYIEWKVTIANNISAGSCVVRVDGVEVITVGTGQDLQATSDAYATQLCLWDSSNTAVDSTYRYFDDLYLCNASGTTNNDFLGDVRIDTLYPNANGTHQTFTPSTGTDHYAVVDEATLATTDYLSGGSLTKETNALTDLPLAETTVLAVQVCNATAKSDAGTATAKNLIRSGSSEATGTDVALSTSYSYQATVFEQDPATSSAWTVSGVNALEAGVERTA